MNENVDGLLECSTEKFVLSLVLFVCIDNR